MKALGLIETKGITGAIEAADVALKTAQVELINKESVKGGIITIQIEGDVAAVKAAVEAGAAAAQKVGTLIASHVIPRPDNSVEYLLKRKLQNKKTEEENVTTVENQEAKNEENEAEENVVEEVEEIEEINEILKVNKKNKKNRK